MPIAPTFQTYLASKNIEYDVISHEPTISATRTAEAAQVAGDRVAKAVLVRDKEAFILAILPASHRIDLPELKQRLGVDAELATEADIDRFFRDCAQGAVPAAGECYGLDVIVDDSLESQPDIYLEGGDHRTLVHMTHAQFARLTGDARHGRFSVHG